MDDRIPIPRDIIALSRRILHCANQGIAQQEFLREISDLLIRYSGCDVLQVRCFGEATPYRWTAHATGEEPFHFDPRAPEDLRATPDIVADVLARAEIEPGSPCLTQNGSFCTGDVARDLADFGAESARGAVIIPEGIRSILLVPLQIHQAERAYLLLGSKQAGFFVSEEVARLEAMAQTVAQAIADRRGQAALRERVKELTCLYRISQIKADADRPFSERLQEMVQQLPAAWQYPDDAVAQVILDEQRYSTGPCDATHVRQSAPIKVAGRIRGRVEIGYLRDRPEFVEGPFLPEEQSLIDAVARELSLFVEQVELGNRRAQLEEQLRHADRLAMIGTLASGIAHEINEPLESIIGFAQLLEKQALPDDQRRDLAKIMSGGLHAREIVRKLLLFARQEPLKKGPVDLAQVIRESVTMLEARIAKARVRLHVALADNLPVIAADTVQLRQVVLNLIMNAVQAMPDGGELTIRAYKRDDTIALVVEDTGLGLTDAVKKRLFAPFYTTKEVGEGTGLGLSVVHGIVVTHGGTIEVASEPGRGTRFEICLPLVPLNDGI